MYFWVIIGANNVREEAQLVDARFEGSLVYVLWCDWLVHNQVTMETVWDRSHGRSSRAAHENIGLQMTTPFFLG